MGVKSYQRFEDFDLSKKLLEAVMEARLERPTELQMQVIPLALDNRDVIFEARSGMGKSACFAIPFIQHWLRDRTRKAIIISPTADSVQQLGKVISRLCPILKAKVLKFTKRDDYFFPEFHEKCPIAILEFSVADRFIKREKEFIANVKSLGLDDFELLVEKGKELEDLIHTISADRQTLISAGELNEDVLDKGRWFCDPNRMEKVKLSRPESQWPEGKVKLNYLVVDEQNRIAPLADILSSCKNEITLIVTDSDRISRTISEELEKKEITAEVLAYSMQLDEKQKIVSAVMEKNCGVMVSCEAALNGLNLPKIDHLISWELPSHLENYWNRLDRFTYQGDLNVTVLVDTARSGAIRILEKRLGRSMTALPGSLPIPSGNERGRPQPREDRRISSRPIDNDPVIKKNYDEKVIPQRFRDPVFTDPSDVEKYAPEGLKNKSLGSKFVPSGKKKSKKKE